MIHKELYPMPEEAVVPTLETLVDSYIDKNRVPKATFIGVTDKNIKINESFIFINGVNECIMMVEDILKKARRFDGRLRINTRFHLLHQLELFLPEEEIRQKSRAHQEIDPKDDFRWHLTVRYNEWREEPVDSLVVSMSTNGVDEIPEDDNYKSLYEILFGNTLSSYLNH